MISSPSHIAVSSLQAAPPAPATPPAAGGGVRQVRKTTDPRHHWRWVPGSWTDVIATFCVEPSKGFWTTPECVKDACSSPASLTPPSHLHTPPSHLQAIKSGIQETAIKLFLNCGICLLAVISLGLADAALVVFVFQVTIRLLTSKVPRKSLMTCQGRAEVRSNSSPLACDSRTSH